MSQAGQLVPLVMIPRFTSYFGTSEFATVALDVSRYSGGLLSLWRGDLIGGGTFTLYTETSHDGYEWFEEPVGGRSPAADAPESSALDLSRRYFRVRVVLTGTDPGVTCWCEGMLEYRIDS